MIALKHNLIALARLFFDTLPTFLVKRDVYLSLRRGLSANPQRFGTPVANDVPYVNGQWKGRNLARAKTDLVIEGFPGSGNSFVSNCVRDMAQGTFFIESHFHYIVQLKRALAFGVPCVIIVRDPASATNSLKSKEPLLWDGLILLRWILYHRFVLRKLAPFHVFLFEDIVHDVDLIRRNCPVVQHMVKKTILPNLAYQNPARQHTSLQKEQRLVRCLLKYANEIYGQIQKDLTPRK